MGVKHLALRGLLSTVGRSGSVGLLPQRGGCVVLTLHHVRPDGPAGFHPNAGLSITPDFLHRLLTMLRDYGWKPISVEDLTAGVVNDRDRLFAVTLDDGYRNNVEWALPVFRRNRVPFTVFVTPGFADRRAELWWEALERIVGASDSVRLPGEAAPTPTRTRTEKMRAYWRMIERLGLGFDEDAQRRAVRAIAAAHGLDFAALAEELTLDWDEVRGLAREPLASIGAHTDTHPALARLDRPRAYTEMRGSADRIAAEVGRRPIAIAFPYGHAYAAGQREGEIAREAGFAASFTTRPGAIFPGDSLHVAPRVSVNGFVQSLSAMRVLAEPSVWAFRRRLAHARAA